jgi:predicted transcriptional regulator
MNPDLAKLLFEQNSMSYGDMIMSDTGNVPQTLFIGRTATIVTSYVSNNTIAGSALPKMIQTVHDTLKELATGVTSVVPPTPAVNPKKSVFPDHLICLEDGRRLATLKRHLMSTYKMTPDQYRARWNLPFNYPMVAPNYSKRRRELALETGLGTAAKEAKAPAKPRLKQ